MNLSPTAAARAADRMRALARRAAVPAIELRHLAAEADRMSRIAQAFPVCPAPDQRTIP